MTEIGDALFRQMSTLVREQQAEMTESKPEGHFDWRFVSTGLAGSGVVIFHPHGTDANNFVEDNLDFKDQRFARVGDDWQDWSFVMYEQEAGTITNMIEAAGFNLYEIEVEGR